MDVMVVHSLIQKNGKSHARDVSETTETIGEEVNRMTNAEAKAKIKKLLMAEIDRLPSHYDSEINEVVYSDTAEVNELLELNKIVSEAFDALELQTPKTPIDNTERQWFECPTCRRVVVTYHAGKRHHCECGQSLKWSDEE